MQNNSDFGWPDSRIKLKVDEVKVSWPNDAPNQTRSAPQTKPEEDANDEHFKRCTLCGAQFATHQGLGGHMSKSHKNMSLVFREKQKKRKLRATERLITQLAK